MADFVFNIAKGRVIEFFQRVDLNDPANSAIIIVPVDVGATTDATLRDFTTLSAVLGAATERSTSNWNRKTLTDADLGPFSPDNVNDRFDITIGNITWTPGPTAGNVTDLLVCYDNDTTGGTDANIIPLLQYDFPITPDSSDVIAAINASGLFRAA